MKVSLDQARINIKTKYEGMVNSLFFAAFVYIAAFLTVIYITGYELKLLKTHQLIDHIIKDGIDYEAFRDIRISEEVMETANRKVNHIHKQNPVLGNHPYINPIGYLTFTMLAKDYNPLEKAPIDEETFLRGISKLQATKHFQELYGYYDAILSGLRYFPVPKVNDSNSDISYVDTWYALRKYGGNRRHEGTDLMSDNNIRGYYPVVSITDGVVENLGWLDKGGYRVGIRSNTGGYFYYAHLYSYAPNLQEGDSVIAGQLIGFMGDSGYGSEGTVGKFDVHLHLGIYVDTDTGELSVNPYWILKMLEKNRTYYHMEEMN